MEAEFVLIGVLVIFLIITVPAGIFYYSHKIYTKSYTFNDFAKWIFLCFLFFFLYLTGEPSLTYGSILGITLGYFGFLLAFINLFFLLRIEERGFEHKYSNGFFISLIVYLMLVASYFLSKFPVFSPISLMIALNSSINLLSILLFLGYNVKIVYNKLIKNERIKYPIILPCLLFSILLTQSVINGIRNSLHFIFLLTLLVLSICLVFYPDWLKKWLKNVSKKDYVNQNDKKNSILNTFSKIISDRILNREIPIEESEYPLNDEIRNAIINSKSLDIKNRDLKQLEFMLLCANQQADTLNNEFNASLSFAIAGITLMLAPFLGMLYSFFIYVDSFQMHLFTVIPNFQPILERILSKFDDSTQLLVLLILLFIIISIPYLFISLFEPNSKTKIWIYKSKITSGLYELIPIITFAGLVIKWALSSELDPVDFSLFCIGLMFHTEAYLTILPNRKRLINANKIILDLNNKIIFYEENECK